MHTDVLIIGAGPTGLVLALWLTKHGVKVRIVDKTAEPGTTSRALAVQARTLELYRQLDLTNAVLKLGHKVPAVNLWVKGEPVARLPFERVGSDLRLITAISCHRRQRVTKGTVIEQDVQTWRLIAQYRTSSCTWHRALQKRKAGYCNAPRTQARYSGFPASIGSTRKQGTE